MKARVMNSFRTEIPCDICDIPIFQSTNYVEVNNDGILLKLHIACGLDILGVLVQTFGMNYTDKQLVDLDKMKMS